VVDPDRLRGEVGGHVTWKPQREKFSRADRRRASSRRHPRAPGEGFRVRFVQEQRAVSPGAASLPRDSGRWY
jgi:hypothetical protein